ncbi:hypothetical protein [Haloferax sp. DFSO60]|uniref:hypothetical protein n=1 Tax=Haloferax sp. DFSO60 TaxID=3388652 RepID=UPI00397A6717
MFERFESNRYTIRGISTTGVIFFASLVAVVYGDVKITNPFVVLLLVVFGGVFFYLTAGSIHELLSDGEKSDERDSSS